MEPYKIEKQLREKLNKREIQPSAQAWDRLDAMLSVAEEKKNKAFFWLVIYSCQHFGFRISWYVFLQSRKSKNKYK